MAEKMTLKQIVHLLRNASEDAVNPRYRKKFKEAADALEVDHLAQPAQASRGATHCDNCGCTWLDDGLNPVGCPYCKKSAQEVDVGAIREVIDDLKSFPASDRSVRLSNALTRAIGNAQEERCDHDWAIGYGVPPYCSRCGEPMSLPTPPQPEE